MGSDFYLVTSFYFSRSGHSNQSGSGGMNRSSTESGSSSGAGSHAQDSGSLLDALAGESLTEKERRLSETIAELQKLREQMIAQRSGSSSSDYTDKVRQSKFHIRTIFKLWLQRLINETNQKIAHQHTNFNWFVHQAKRMMHILFFLRLFVGCETNPFGNSTRCR